MKEFFDYAYLNPIKVESLFAQLNGHIVNERKERTEKGIKGSGKFGIELGNILATLGLAKATTDGELSSDYSKILEITTTLSIENKLDVFQAYVNKHRQIANIDSSLSKHSEICASIRSTDFQTIKGVFDLSINNLTNAQVDRLVAEVAFRNAIALSQDKDINVEFLGEPIDKSLLKHKNGILLSYSKNEDTIEPLVQVPVFVDFFRPNQAFGSTDNSLSVFGNSLIKPTFIIVNPIAMWYRYN